MATTNLAAVLAAALFPNIDFFSPEFDDNQNPKHEPYGQPIVVSVARHGETPGVCVLDICGIWRDATSNPVGSCNATRVRPYSSLELTLHLHQMQISRHGWRLRSFIKFPTPLRLVWSFGRSAGATQMLPLDLKPTATHLWAHQSRHTPTRGSWD